MNFVFLSSVACVNIAINMKQISKINGVIIIMQIGSGVLKAWRGQSNV